MKKTAKAFSLVMILGLVIISCSKDSSGEPKTCKIEGRVVSCSGKPIAGLKVLARAAQPINGDDRRVIVTARPDGVFNFGRLIPETDYILEPVMKDYTFSTSVFIKTGRQDSTTILPELMMVRLMQNKEGIITDTYTEMQWLPDSGKDMAWDDARTYVQGLKVGGHSDWRLPVRVELSYLFEKKTKKENFNISELFKLGRSTVWTGESCAADSFTVLEYVSGLPRCASGASKNRVLPVRYGQQ